MGSVTAQATRVLVIEPVEHQVAALKNCAGNGLDVAQCGQMGTRTAKVRFQGRQIQRAIHVSNEA